MPKRARGLSARARGHATARLKPRAGRCGKPDSGSGNSRGRAMRRRPSKLVTATAAVIIAVAACRRLRGQGVRRRRRTPAGPQLTVVAPQGTHAPAAGSPARRARGRLRRPGRAGQAGHRRRRRRPARTSSTVGAGPQHRPDRLQRQRQTMPIASVVKLFIADDLLLQESKGQTTALPRRPQGARHHAAVLRRQRRRDLLGPQRWQRRSSTRVAARYGLSGTTAP